MTIKLTNLDNKIKCYDCNKNDATIVDLPIKGDLELQYYACDPCWEIHLNRNNFNEARL